MKMTMREVFRILCILAVQLLVGYIVTRTLLKTEWDVVDFITDPAMIAFWVSYLGIECVLRFVKHRKEKAKLTDAENERNNAVHGICPDDFLK